MKRCCALPPHWARQTLPEDGYDLNQALTRACQAVLHAGADAMLILPSDLPLITAGDIDSLHDLGLSGVAMVIAPSHDGGTNALLLHPPNAIDFAFGVDSFRRHLDLAAARTLPYSIFASETLAYDVDWPEDLLLLA